MPIEILGPTWPTVQALRTVLADAPESGTYRVGGPPTDSITQLIRFREAGLRTPNFTTCLAAAMDWVAAGHTVFGRKLIHTRGNDIVLPGPLRNIATRPYNLRWMRSDWWSRYIPPTEEWRIHVFDNQIIARGKKIHSGKSWRKAPVRNVGNGWTFDFHSDPPKGLRKTAREAVQALGYPAGGVDILQVTSTPPGGDIPPTNEFYVLEVNRLPALTCPYTLGAWASAIRRKFQTDIE
jgi:hypothetical protein